jgi:hypothetical protein
MILFEEVAMRRHCVRLPALLLAACCLLACLIPTGCRGKNEPPALSGPTDDPLANASIPELLTAGRYDLAFAAARKAASDPVAARTAAEDLIAWADRQGRADVAAVYLAAAGVSPTTAGAYVGLAALFAKYDAEQMDLPGRQQMLSFWKQGLAAAPELGKDRAAVAAASALATAAGDFVYAAEIAPDNGEAQLRAGLWCCIEQSSTEALTYISRARELLGERADVLVALAVCGQVVPAPVEMVTDLPVSLNQGWVAAVSDTHVFALDHVATPGCYRLSRIARVDGVKTILSESCDSPVALSPDGRWLAYGSYAEWGEPCEIRLASLAGESDRVLTKTKSDVFCISWLPDSQSLVFTSYEGMVLARLDGSGRQLLLGAKDPGLETADCPTDCRVSPDGRHVAYVPCAYEGSGPVMVMTIAGGSVTPVGESMGTTPEWLNSSRLIFGTYTDFGESDSRVWVSEVGGPSSAEPVLGESLAVSLVGLSADKHQVLLGLMPRYPGPPTGERLYWVCELQTRQLRLLPIESDASGVTWAADGTIFYWHDGRVAGIRLK